MNLWDELRELGAVLARHDEFCMASGMTADQMLKARDIMKRRGISYEVAFSTGWVILWEEQE